MLLPSFALVLPPLARTAARTLVPRMADAWTFTALTRAVEDHRVASAVLSPDATLRAVDVHGATHITQLFPAQASAVADRLVAAGVDLTFVPPTGASVLLRQLLDLFPLAILGFLVLGAAARAGGGGGGIGGIGLGLGMAPRRESALQCVENVEARFEDVAGCTSAKQELEEVVHALTDPERFARAGARVPKGVLLEGPPGTGKTLLARAVAGEAGVAFLSASASSFVEMYVGLGAARVRSLFAEAARAAPCIVWIDELDAVGRRRATGGGGVGGGNEERETTLNELLSAMDGFNATAGVVVLAATNRAEVLDDALLRPGRFDRRVPVSLPTRAERVDILRVHARNRTLDDPTGQLLRDVAAQTPGFSGADLANVMNEAAIRATRRNATVITRADAEGAVDRAVMGLAKDDDASETSDRVRTRTAVHEAGHTLVGVLLSEYDDLVSRVTIVPRSSGAGGFTAFVPGEDRAVEGLYTADYLRAKLAVLLAGRAAEEIVLGRDVVSTGSSSDLARANTLARRMVTEWGFGSTLNAHGASSAPVALSAATTATIDRDVEELVDTAYGVALSVVNDNLLALRRVADALVDERTLSRDRILELVTT